LLLLLGLLRLLVVQVLRVAAHDRREALAAAAQLHAAAVVQVTRARGLAGIISQ
jgi:hypothetical protein